MGVAVRLPAWLNDASVSYPAENDRLTLSGLLAPGGSALGYRSGVLPSVAAALQVAAQGTPNMTVAVSPGQALIAGTLTATQGGYLVTSDSSVTLTIAAADPTNPRYDIVVLTVEDKQYAGTNNDGILQVITGTPNATPAVPATPANSIVLAQIHVTAGKTSILAGDITDQRVYTAARGGVIPCLSTAHPSSPYSGMAIFETDTKLVKIWDGTTWREPSELANPPYFEAEMRTAQTFQSWGTGIYDGEVEDTHGAYNPTTATFTAPRAGIYEFTSSIVFAYTATAEDVYIAFDVNNSGAFIALAGGRINPTTSPHQFALSTAFRHRLAVGDTVITKVYSSGSNPSDVSQGANGTRSSRFSGVWVRP